jgi:hypothetical protein
MTDETTQSTVESTITDAVESQPANDGVNISVEQILAAILNKVGPTNIALDDLVANYSTKTISVNQLEDRSVTFELVDISEVPTQESAE